MPNSNSNPSSLRTITIRPTANHTHTVIFLHGRGDNARNFVNALRHTSKTTNQKSLIAALPSFRWLVPQAPTRRCASLPESWPQWFDVWDVSDFAEREELQAEGLREVVPMIRELIASEAEMLGGRWDRVVLAGISMGGATGIHTLFNLDIPAEKGGRLGAFLGFSCRCPFVGRDLAGMRAALGLDDVPAGDSVLRDTPVLLQHCVDDPLVLVDDGRRLRDILTRFGATVQWKEYEEGGHWFNAPDGMDDVLRFLQHALRESRPEVEEDVSMDLT